MSDFTFNTVGVEREIANLKQQNIQIFMDKALLSMKIMELRMVNNSPTTEKLSNSLARQSALLSRQLHNSYLLINTGKNICSKVKKADRSAAVMLNGQHAEARVEKNGLTHINLPLHIWGNTFPRHMILLPSPMIIKEINILEILSDDNILRKYSKKINNNGSSIIKELTVDAKVERDIIDVNEEFKNLGLRKEVKKEGTLLGKDNKVSKLYEDKATILETEVNKSAEVNWKDKTYKSKFGTIGVKVGNAEVHGGASAGFYVMGKDGKKVFAPGVNAKVGVSATALRVDYNKTLVKGKYASLDTKADVKVLTAGVDGEANIRFNGANTQVQVGGEAEALLAEAEGETSLNVLGVEGKVTGSINFGVGAHANLGYKNGVLKYDLGASLGVGGSLGGELNVSKLTNIVIKKSSSAIMDSSKELAKGFKNIGKSFGIKI